MNKSCKNFNQVINRLNMYGFDFISETTKNRKTCLWFEGISFINIQFIIGCKYHAELIGMRGSHNVYEITRV